MYSWKSSVSLSLSGGVSHTKPLTPVPHHWRHAEELSLNYQNILSNKTYFSDKICLSLSFLSDNMDFAYNNVRFTSSLLLDTCTLLPVW